MMEALFLITATGEEIYVHEPPVGFAAGPGERLETRPISEEEYARLSDATRFNFKLYLFCEGYLGSRTLPPSELNYRLLNLHRKEVLDKGLRVAVEYYTDFLSEDRYEDLIVREEHTYQYMPYRAIPVRRDIEISWYLNDGTVGHTKIKTRHFVGTEGAKVHEKRKEANVMNIKAIIFHLFTLHLGPDEGLSRVNILFGYLFQTIETYVKGHEGFLIDAVAAYEDEVFDYPLTTDPGAPTIRQYLISELDIPKFIPNT